MLFTIMSKNHKVLFSFDKADNSIKDTLEEAVRQGVSLCHANLCNADLRGAKLRGAILSGADLSCADFRDADLSCAKLICADLSDAAFNNADLSNAYISYSYLPSTDFKGANFSGLHFYGADFRFSKNVPDLPMVCPKEGSFIGWKKIWKYKDDYCGDFIVKLEIPVDAMRSSASGIKCRCSYAKVLEIKSIDTDECMDTITNTNVSCSPCTYKVGEFVYPDGFDENRWEECSNGIHFFMTRKEAEELKIK